MRPQNSRLAVFSSKAWTNVGSYLLAGLLGEGAFGKVHTGCHTLTGEHVAVKIVEKSLIKTFADVERVVREIQFLSVMDHPNVVKLFEVIETDTRIFLVMELITSGELYDYLRANTNLSEEKAQLVFAQILCAIEHCHACGIIHRDVKPENILIGPTGTIKLCDFGLSNLAPAFGRYCKAASGSISYAAPETISGAQRETPAVDVWGAGVTLYALLVGNLPYTAVCSRDMLSQILRAPPTFPAHVSAAARDLISRMLHVDPRCRIATADIWAHPWMDGVRAWLRREGLATGPDAPPLELDVEILYQLSKRDIPWRSAIADLHAGRLSAERTSYLLLAAKKARQGGSLRGDRNSRKRLGITVRPDGVLCDTHTLEPIAEALIRPRVGIAKLRAPCISRAPDRTPPPPFFLETEAERHIRPSADVAPGARVVVALDAKELARPRSMLYAWRQRRARRKRNAGARAWAGPVNTRAVFFCSAAELWERLVGACEALAAQPERAQGPGLALSCRCDGVRLRAEVVVLCAAPQSASVVFLLRGGPPDAASALCHRILAPLLRD